MAIDEKNKYGRGNQLANAITQERIIRQRKAAEDAKKIENAAIETAAAQELARNKALLLGSSESVEAKQDFYAAQLDASKKERSFTSLWQNIVKHNDRDFSSFKENISSSISSRLRTGVSDREMGALREGTRNDPRKIPEISRFADMGELARSSSIDRMKENVVERYTSAGSIAESLTIEDMRLKKKSPAAEMLYKQLHGVSNIQSSLAAAQVAQELAPSFSSAVGHAGKVEARSVDTLKMFDIQKDAGKDVSQLTSEFKTLAKTIKEMNSLQEKGVKIQSDYNSEIDSSKKKIIDEEYTKNRLQLEIKTAEAKEQEDKLRKGLTGQDSSGNRIDNVMIGARFLGTAASAAGQIAVDQSLDEARVRTGYADLANRQYDRANAIAGGDVHSMYRELAYKNSIQFGAGIRAAVNVTETAGIAAGLTVAGASAVGGIKGAINPGTAIADSTNAVAGAAVRNSALMRGITGGQYELAAIQAGTEASYAQNYVRADAQQKFLNANMQAYRATAGLGTNMTGFMQNMKSNVALGGYASIEEYMQTAAMGKSMGAYFNSDVLTQAGQAQRTGILDKQTYMENIGKLSDVGGAGAQENMAKILSQAVTLGMDNSKNISEMVSGIHTLSSTSATLGVSTSTANAGMMASVVQALTAAGVDKNIASKAALSGLSVADRASQSVDLSFGSVLEAGGLAKKFSGASVYELSALSAMSQAQLKTVSKGGKEANRALESLGLEDVFKKSGLSYKDFADSVMSEKSNKMLGQFVDPSQLKEVAEDIKQFGISGGKDKLSARTRQILGARGISAETFAAYHMKEVSAGKMGTDDVAREAADLMNRTGAEQQKKNYEYGEETSGGMASLVNELRALTKAMTPQQSADAAKAGYENFSVPQALVAGSKQMHDASKNMIIAADKMLEAVSNIPFVGKKPGENILNASNMNFLDKSIPGRVETRNKENIKAAKDAGLIKNNN